MPLDADHAWTAEQVLTGAELHAMIDALHPLEPLEREPSATARVYSFADGQGRIGFISPVSEPFCGDCNRIRLTADGRLRTCLFSLGETDLREPLRDRRRGRRAGADHPRRRLAQGAQAPHRRARLHPARANDVSDRRLSVEAGPLAGLDAGRPRNTRREPVQRIEQTSSSARLESVMEGSTEVRSWLRCYRCWSQNLEVQLHYEGIHRIDPETGERTDVVDEMQEAVVQCLECMHDQPHLGFHNGRVEPIQDRWERMITGTPWIASCTVTVDADDVETCSGPDAGDSLSYAAFGDHGTREFFTHVRFHKHDEDRIVVHLLVELYARTPRKPPRSSRTPLAAPWRSRRWRRNRVLRHRPAVAPTDLVRRRPEYAGHAANAISTIKSASATGTVAGRLSTTRNKQVEERRDHQREQRGEPLNARARSRTPRPAALPRTGRRSPS